MNTFKILAAIVAGFLLSFTAALVAPIVLFNASAPDGPFGLYYGISTSESVAIMVIAAAVMVVATPAAIAVLERKA